MTFVGLADPQVTANSKRIEASLMLEALPVPRSLASRAEAVLFGSVTDEIPSELLLRLDSTHPTAHITGHRRPLWRPPRGSDLLRRGARALDPTSTAVHPRSPSLRWLLVRSARMRRRLQVCQPESARREFRSARSRGNIEDRKGRGSWTPPNCCRRSPKKSAAGDMELRLVSRWSLAVLSWCGDPEARKKLAASQDWEVADRGMTELNLLSLPVAVLNACNNPKMSLVPAVAILAPAIGNAVARHALAGAAPWSGWYKARPLAAQIEKALDALGDRLRTNRALPMPAGFTGRDPYLVDYRYVLAFDVSASLARVEVRPCQSFGEKVRAACCAACGIWFLAAEGEPVLCPAHRGPHGVKTVKEYEHAMTKGRSCPRCHEPIAAIDA